MDFCIQKCQTHRELYTANPRQEIQNFYAIWWKVLPKLLISPKVFRKLLMSPFFPYNFPTSCKYKTDDAFSVYTFQYTEDCVNFGRVQ